MENFAKNLKDKLRGSKRGGVYDLITFDSLSSTNDYLKEKAGELKDFSVVVAERQSAGKGRLGRKFCSLDGGVYMSILVRPRPDFLTKITPMTAVAVQEAIALTFGKTPKIKWVNDLYFGNKKVSGILCESSICNDKTDYVIVGIGVNVYEPKGGFPDEIKDIAGAITTPKEGVREELIVNILDCFYDYFTGKEFLESYRKNSYLCGKNLEIRIGNEEIKGKFVEIDEEFRLVVNTPKGERRFSSGEVMKVVSDEKNC